MKYIGPIAFINDRTGRWQQVGKLFSNNAGNVFYCLWYCVRIGQLICKATNGVFPYIHGDIETKNEYKIGYIAASLEHDNVYHITIDCIPLAGGELWTKIHEPNSEKPTFCGTE